MTHALATQIDEVERLAKTERTDAMQVSRATGEFLAAVALSLSAKRIVEVGTSYGFSGLWWSAALAIHDGRLDTIDASEKKFEASKAAFAAAGVTDRVTGHFGDARAILATLKAPIDVAFIDADKPSTQAYFDLLWPLVRVGGAVLTDNVLSHREEMAAYVSGLRARDDAHALIVPIGSGVAWAVKLR